MANPIYNNEIQTYRGMSLQELEDFTEAGAGSPTPYVELGDRYLQNHELKKAEAAYLTAIDKNINFRFAYEGLGQIYIEWERYDEAIKCFEKAIERKLLHFKAYENLAVIYATHLDKKDKAVEVLHTFEDSLMKIGKKDYMSKQRYYRNLSKIYEKINEPEKYWKCKENSLI